MPFLAREWQWAGIMELECQDFKDTCVNLISVNYYHSSITNQVNRRETWPKGLVISRGTASERLVRRSRTLRHD